jgi:hypothetical protein
MFWRTPNNAYFLLSDLEPCKSKSHSHFAQNSATFKICKHLKMQILLKKLDFIGFVQQQKYFTQY